MSNEEIKLYTGLFKGRQLAIANFLRKKYGRLLENDIDDVLQDTYLKGSKYFKPEQAGAFNTWIIYCANSVAVDRCRWKYRLSRASAAVMAEPNGEQYVMAEDFDTQRLVERHENKRLLETAIARLPDLYRQVMSLRVLEDLSYKEVADRLGISIEKVIKRLYRARVSLLEQFVGADEAIAA